MRANRYGKFLTILLIVLIIGVLVGVGFLVFNVVQSKNNDDRTIEAIDEFDKTLEESKQDEEQGKEENGEVLENLIAPPDDSSTSSNTENKKIYYEGFVMIGYITIPKTNVKLPIFDHVDPSAIEIGAATIYPSNPQLNEPGNVVMVGHNYNDGRLFAGNERLSVGDKVLIRDTTGRELSYTIYEKFETTDTDTSFYTRNTNGVAEITLSTCTDDSKARIIILAKAN